MRLNVPKLPSVGALLFGGPGMVSMRASGGGAMSGRDGPLLRRLFKLKGSSVLAISRGDLTLWEGDAIVNAANERMLGGEGVDGAIHRAAGRQLVEACYDVEEVSRNVRCPTGEARITPGFRLPAKYVIHTVGPVYRGHTTSAPLLRGAIKNSLLLCKENGLKSIAFPAISCGVYGYPADEAAKVAIATILEFSEGLDLIEFVLFGPNTYHPFTAEASKALDLQQPDDAASNEHDDEANEESKGEGFPSKSESCEKSAEEGIPCQPETSSGSADEGDAMEDSMDTAAATAQEMKRDAEGKEPIGEETNEKPAKDETILLETSACVASATSAEKIEDATVTAEPMSQSQDEDFASEAQSVDTVRDDVEVQEAKRQKPTEASSTE